MDVEDVGQEDGDRPPPLPTHCPSIRRFVYCGHFPEWIRNGMAPWMTASMSARSLDGVRRMHVGNATENVSAYRPTREPIFTETMQIGIVVRDLDATLRRYVDDYGIGPWEVFEVTPENAPDLYHDGQPVKGSTRAAVTMVGNVWWELIQPLDEQGIFARFLAEKGEGVHHVAVATPNFDDVVAERIQRGITLPLSGTFSGVKVAYLPTDRDLGVILEIFSGMPGADHESDATEDA
jgi:methylmalonyl-CoA/ethylmalonyl-CoA epimerase